MRQPAIGLGQRIQPDPEPLRLALRILVQQSILGMQQNRHVVPCANCGNSEHVIDVGVGEPDGLESPGPGAKLRQEHGRLLARVHDDRLAGPGVGHQVAVLGELAVGQRDDIEAVWQHAHAWTAIPWALRSVRYFSTAIAAVVASPTAVVTWRVSWTRRSPAANSPGMLVCIRSSVTM